jgi:YfiH family protein
MPISPAMPDFIVPDWPAPANVHAVVTTRRGGVSVAPYDSFNLAAHVGDDPTAVAANRARLREQLRLPAEPWWLEQVHATGVVEAGRGSRVGDASFSRASSQVCAVLTADCLPLLLCDRDGQQVAASHAGWRGLHAGVIEATVACFPAPAGLLAWLGPAIGPRAFEVGADVWQAFIERDPANAGAFVQTDASHWLCDIYRLARQVLSRCGVSAVYGGGGCTFEDRERFYSYRRDGATGRQASLIWLD